MEHFISISISHKTAPVEIRALFSFSVEEQERFLGDIADSGVLKECVLLSTCNRTELYFRGNNQNVLELQQRLAQFKQMDVEVLRKHFLIYMEEKAIQHLFQVTCGMDSMVVGEDEILGQTKEAYERALKLGTTKYLLNTLFQAAITCAKKIKTETRLSKTSISIGTLVANEVMGYQKESKKVLIIGVSGKMGSIVMKNLYGKPGIKLVGTTRSHSMQENIHGRYEKLEIVSYQDRYRYMDEADIIISATTSPHYTITYLELAANIVSRKERIFIDLSVPMDIDKDIIKQEGAILHDMDYYEEVARHNILIKEQEIIEAQRIMEKHMEETRKEISFHEFLPQLPKVKQRLAGRSFEHILYELKEKASHEELSGLLKLLQEMV
ncbi:MAG TPA: glutamyl-tRNA reductase [Clostridiales bacterium]|nr:glutamyl-tRNA reductase [Clostridiales bacterium]